MLLHRVTAAAIAALVLVIVSLLSPAAAAGLSAEWAGAYGYEDGRQAVPFVLTLTQNGAVITGRIDEVQTFGTKSSDDKLGASVVGSVNGHVVAFTKTYDGKGGQTHTVRYHGTLVVDGEFKFMFGTWRLGSDVGSWFATIAKD